MTAGEEPYWTSREAAVWIATRDVGAVHASASEESSALDYQTLGPALNSLIAACRDGRIRAVGRRCEWPPWYLTYDTNPVSVHRVMNGGKPSDRFESIPGCEWINLKWVLSGRELVLCSKDSGRRQWVMVQFPRSDLTREWRAKTKPTGGRNRGRPPDLIITVTKKMIDDIKQRGRARLEGMMQKQLGAEYGCGRTTAGNARRAALAETGPISEQVKNSISGKY
jgi:hypothetical protein